ncbi:hypothetical protein [Streptosporangium sp. NPDC087985]|uniref:hypothetical protein n=1 Tax=Streptosporangium sp. NPDC087985 TaxID=3366196 RepID=UPI0037FC9717
MTVYAGVDVAVVIADSDGRADQHGAPVAVVRGAVYDASDEGVAAMLHHRPG